MPDTIGITELVRSIARITHQRNRAVRATMRCLLDEIGEELARGHIVKLMNFGTFENKAGLANRHDPRTGLPCDDRRRIIFRACALVKKKAQRIAQETIDAH